MTTWPTDAAPVVPDVCARLLTNVTCAEAGVANTAANAERSTAAAMCHLAMDAARTGRPLAVRRTLRVRSPQSAAPGVSAAERSPSVAAQGGRIGRITRRLPWLREYRCGRCRVRCRRGNGHIAVEVTRFRAGKHERMSGRRWRPKGTGGEAQRGCGALAGAVRTGPEMGRPGVGLAAHGAAVRGGGRCSRCCGRRDG